MKKNVFLFILIFFLTTSLIAQPEYFTGEVYKVYKYRKVIICKGPDLTPIKVDRILYICDENNKQIAAVKVTRYFTTIIETELISGKIELIKVKMPVYSHRIQFEKKQLTKVLKYEKEYDYYWWDVEIHYRAGMKTYTKFSTLIVPRIVELLAKGSDKKVRIGDYEVRNLYIKNMKITRIELKRGESAEIEKININIDSKRIPEFETKTKLIVKRIKGKDAYKIRLIKRKSGCKLSSEVYIGGMVFIDIQSGEFMMGPPDSNPDADVNVKLKHKVNISRFHIGKYEVTVKEFSKFIEEIGYKTDADREGGSYIWNGSEWEKREGVNWKCNIDGKEDYTERLNHPVIHISWSDAVTYCEWFSKKYNVKARLPYEAEWEYVCRAGSTTMYYWGDKIDGNYCWYRDNSEKMTHPVGQKNLNAFGLYDMSGNVWEWCMDWYASEYYKNSPSKNPHGPASGDNKVLRGGSYYEVESGLCSGYRDNMAPEGRGSNVGFRIVISSK